MAGQKTKKWVATVEGSKSGVEKTITVFRQSHGAAAKNVREVAAFPTYFGKEPVHIIKLVEESPSNLEQQ